MVVGRGERIYFAFPVQTLLEVRPAGMTDRPKEVRLERERWVHAIGREREHLKATAESSATADRNNTNLFLSGEGEQCADGGRQACPEQTKAVRG